MWQCDIKHKLHDRPSGNTSARALVFGVLLGVELDRDAHVWRKFPTTGSWMAYDPLVEPVHFDTTD